MLATKESMPQQEPLQSPFCSLLRSKKFYFLQQMPTEAHHLLDATGHCWCRQTMLAIGPDGERAQPSACTAERACYRSLFESNSIESSPVEA